MSLQSWKDEFTLDHVDDPIAHSIRKWEALQPEALARHHVALNLWGVEDADRNRWSIGSDNCALCAEHLSCITGCKTCPLYIVRGNVACDDERDDEVASPWSRRFEAPHIMLEWLRKLSPTSGPNG